MSSTFWLQVLHVLETLAVPLLLGCCIRKAKALMQGRPGPPFLQPIFDLAKRYRKGETVSSASSWIFRANPVLGLCIIVLLALVTPWSGAAPIAKGSGAADLILVAYLFALARFASLLAALDTGSPFGGLGASREAVISVVIEPGVLISLGAVALASRSMDLSIALDTPLRGTVAVLSGAAFLVAALAELSRMPVDDPTTHLELTMIHEATILENSGRNLALIETTVLLRTAVLFGIGVRILLSQFQNLSGGVWRALLTAAAILLLGCLLAVVEGITVKLKWRRAPSFVAFSTALAVMSAFVAVTAS